ncbi:hypothetical protein KSP40_PGU014670 [Platanthera guangdongensis]|uniref:Uncharacterized protein n=1 Tax=Platanthera guangdongensis TaxID=2320717 RepID=A0ABR2MZI5_9ASPA
MPYPLYHPTPNTSGSPNPNPSPNPKRIRIFLSESPGLRLRSAVFLLSLLYPRRSSPRPGTCTRTASSPSPYTPFFQHPDPIPNVPPSAPFYTQYQSQPQDSSSQFPPYSQYSSPLFQPDQSSTVVPYSNHLQSLPPLQSIRSQNNYPPQSNPNPDPSHKPDLTTPFSSVYGPSEPPYEVVAPRFDHGGGYYNENSVKYGMTAALPSGQIQPGYDQDYFQRKPETAFLYGHVSAQDDRLGDCDVFLFNHSQI